MHETKLEIIDFIRIVDYENWTKKKTQISHTQLLLNTNIKVDCINQSKNITLCKGYKELIFWRDLCIRWTKNRSTYSTKSIIMTLTMLERRRMRNSARTKKRRTVDLSDLLHVITISVTCTINETNEHLQHRP